MAYAEKAYMVAFASVPPSIAAALLILPLPTLHRQQWPLESCVLFPLRGTAAAAASKQSNPSTSQRHHNRVLAFQENARHRRFFILSREEEGAPVQEGAGPSVHVRGDRACPVRPERVSGRAYMTSTSPAGGTLMRESCRSLWCLTMDGSGAMRSSAGWPSFHGSYARTRPFPRTPSGGITCL
jgi:hypothetical protein